MKVALRTTLLALAMVFAVTLAVRAEDEKKADDKVKTFKGDLGCAKCNAKFFGTKGYTKCTNAIKVTEGKKSITYILDDNGKDEDYHVCSGKKAATVKGTLKGKGKEQKLKPEKDGVKVD